MSGIGDNRSKKVGAFFIRDYLFFRLVIFRAPVNFISGVEHLFPIVFTRDEIRPFGLRYIGLLIRECMVQCKTRGLEGFP